MEPNKDKKLYILMFALVILILIVLRALITSGNDAVIEYNSDTDGMKLISSAEVVEDREIYFILEGIISKFVASYNPEDIDSDVATYEDYYDVLNKSYRNKLGKSKYMELAKNFFSKLEYEDNSGMASYVYVQTTNIIRSIYKIDNDEYVCVIARETGEAVGFIGISLDTQNNTFEIFYIE